MNNASRILYKVGKVFSIIRIVFCALAIIGCAYGFTIKEDLYQQLVDQGASVASVEEVVGLLIAAIVALCIAIVIEAVRLVFVGKALAALDTTEKKPHIVLLVLSVVADTSIFYLLASIFGLIIANQNEKQPQQVQTTDGNLQ